MCVGFEFCGRPRRASKERRTARFDQLDEFLREIVEIHTDLLLLFQIEVVRLIDLHEVEKIRISLVRYFQSYGL